MTKWIAAAILALPLILGGSASIDSAAAAPSQAAAQAGLQASDLGARGRTRRRAHHFRRAHEGFYYLDRPYYYAPAPFVPFNFGYPLLPPQWW